MCRLPELQKRPLQEKRIDQVLSLHPLHASAATEKVRPLREAVVRDVIGGSAAGAPNVGKLTTRFAYDDQEACRRCDAFRIVAMNSSLCIYLYAHTKLAEISLKFANVSLTPDARTKKPVFVVAESYCRGGFNLMLKDEAAPNDVWAFLVNGDMDKAREVLSWFVAEGAFSKDLFDHYNFKLSGLATAFKERGVIRRDLFSSCVLIEDHLGIEHNDFDMTTPCLMCSIQVSDSQPMFDRSCSGGRALTLLSGQSSSVEALIRHEVSLILDIGEHPNIAKFYGAFDVSHLDECSAFDSDVCWALLMDSYQYTLLDAVRKTPYHESQCVQLAKSLLGALQHVHSAGIVHRRVQPASVQIWPCGRFVLTGFHQAVRVSEGKELARICCKESYRAPEVCEGREANCDSKIDIFACGLVLYFASSGVEPLSLDVSRPQELAVRLTKSLSDIARQKPLKGSGLAPPKRFSSELTTPRHDPHSVKLDFSGRRTMVLSKQFRDLLLSTTRWNPRRRPTAKDALTCEWLGGTVSLSCGEADATDVDVRNLPSLKPRERQTSLAESSKRPQMPLSASSSIMQAILPVGELALLPLMPVAPCGRPTSRFEGRRGGLVPFSLRRHHDQT